MLSYCEQMCETWHTVIIYLPAYLTVRVTKHDVAYSVQIAIVLTLKLLSYNI